MEKIISQRKKKFLQKELWKKKYIWLIMLAAVAAIVAIMICVTVGSEYVGYSVVDVCAVFVAVVSSCISVHLTLKINKLAEQNRLEEAEKIKQEKLYAQIHAQAASFPQFKIDACTVYDLDKLLAIEDAETRKICDDVREHEPATQKKYLLKISSWEAFPAYYKVDIWKVYLKLQTDRGAFSIELTNEHCWVTNNEQFAFWINFDDQNGLIQELKETANERIPGEKAHAQIEVEFTCANILLEWEKNPPHYRVNIDCLVRNKTPNVQVELEVEHRYLSRMDI